MLKVILCILIMGNLFVLFIKSPVQKIIFLSGLDIITIILANTILKFGMLNLILFLSFIMINLFFYFDKTTNSYLKLNSEIILGAILNFILLLSFYFSIKNVLSLKTVFEMTSYQISFSILLLIVLFIIGYLILMENIRDDSNV
jgi:hypothetical protein